jgi:hypothetical protein
MITSLLSSGLDDVREEEREAIVRWLRRMAETLTDPWTAREMMNFAAASIERGEHLKPADEGQGG